MIELAEHFGRGPVLVHVISKNQNISGNYIHVLVSSLKTAGFVRAVRGPNGGYELTVAPAQINVLSIIEALEGRTSLVECTANPCACPRTGECAAQDLWAEVDDAVNNILRNRTLQDLAQSQRQKNNDHSMFHI